MKKSIFSAYGELIIIGLFLGGFLLGLMIISLTRESWLTVLPWLEPDFIWKIEQISVDKRALFFLVMGKRLRAFFLLWLLSRSRLNKAANLLFFSAWGFGTGMVMELFIIRYGLKGLVFYLGMVLPQALFYLPGFYFLGVSCLKRSGEKKYLEFTEEMIRGRKRSRSKRMTGLEMILIGITIESLVNPEIIKKLSELLLG
ncbi:MAG: hypothetical protein IJP31_12025 [Lachnospiraceae bacterium]|nr:hypothetical protein [Lachnospiraceae bacterium]